MKSEFVVGLENAGWPVLFVNSALKIERANLAAARLFGLPTDGEERPLASIWSPLNPAGPDKCLDAWERAPTPSLQVKLRNKDGAYAGFSIFICVFFKDGDKYFLIQILPENAAGTDAPTPTPAAVEEKRTEGDGALAQKQKLECALQLARTVSLDFNNALTSILGHTSLVLGKMEPDNPWRSSLIEVEKSAAWAAEIANDLGMFSRQDKEPKEPTTGNLNAVLQRAHEAFPQPASPGSVQIQWTVLLERQLFTARFDEAKMQQAFVKILENAVEALADGRGRITIQTRNVELAERAQDRNVQLPPGAYVLAEISDDGQGIEPDMLPRIFEPFFTTKGGAHRGLGLAWIYGVVTNLGGGVAISSQPKMGTSVRVYLPAESRIVRDTSTTLQELRGNQAVLIVDDEDLLLTMGRTILTAYGYRVLTANSGQKALEILGREPKIDLVITDLIMPSMSGRELIEQINQQFANLPVLCTSGYVWQGAHEGDTAYLQKPFTTLDLLLKIKQVLASEA